MGRGGGPPTARSSAQPPGTLDGRPPHHRAGRGRLRALRPARDRASPPGADDQRRPAREPARHRRAAEPAEPEWIDAMDDALRGRAATPIARSSTTTPDFVAVLPRGDAASTMVADLRIGSRPAKRKAQRRASRTCAPSRGSSAGPRAATASPAGSASGRRLEASLRAADGTGARCATMYRDGPSSARSSTTPRLGLGQAPTARWRGSTRGWREPEACATASSRDARSRMGPHRARHPRHHRAARDPRGRPGPAPLHPRCATPTSIP